MNPRQKTAPLKPHSCKHGPERKLLGDLRRMIAMARERVARQTNATLVILYWNVGRRIRQDILRKSRAAYGEEIIKKTSRHLTNEYGRGFSARNLAYMVKFAELFPDEGILQALTAKLSWTHFIQIISIDDPLKREHIELLELNEGHLRVATYITELPPKDVLARKLHSTIEAAKQKARHSLSS